MKRTIEVKKYEKKTKEQRIVEKALQLIFEKPNAADLTKEQKENGMSQAILNTLVHDNAMIGKGLLMSILIDGEE